MCFNLIFHNIPSCSYLDGLRSHPANWKQSSALFSVILRLVDVSGHPEVADLDHHVVGDHAVPGCQVPVHNLLDAEVTHPVGDVAGHLQHLADSRGVEAESVVLRVRPPAPEIVLEVAILHELHDDEGGLALGDDAEQLDDVLRVVLLHHARLPQEVNLLSEAGSLIDCLDCANQLTLEEKWNQTRLNAIYNKVLRILNYRPRPKSNKFR